MSRMRTAIISSFLAGLCLLVLRVEAGVVEDYVRGEAFNSGRSALKLEDFPEDLSARELATCLAFLEARQDGKYYRLDVVRQNDLADWLLQHGDYAGRTADALLSVIVDESQQGLWREYALQKLAVAYQKESVSTETRARCLETLFSLTGDSRRAYAATALLGLYRIHVETPVGEQSPLDIEALVAAAKAIIDGTEFSSANKVTALQIGALLGDAGTLEVARRILRDEGADMQLRTSAIATLSRKLNADDRRIVSGLVRHPDYRIRKAAQAALKFSE